jgi:hypothetical protein
MPPGGNVYGIAAPATLPAIYGAVGAADVTLTAGAEVTAITTGAITAANPGDYYPLIWLWLTILFGATAPTALQFAFKLGAGSDVDTFVIEPGLLTNLGEIQVGVPLIGANSATAWQGSGSTINITGKATTTACTVKAVGSRAIVALMRGPDA